jgi:hypothetical protein
MNPPRANRRPPTIPGQTVTERHARWYRGPIVRGMRIGSCVVSRRARGGGSLARAGDRARAVVRTRGALALMAAAGAALVAGCGGGSQATAGEPAGTFAMKVLHASFPAKQSIARPTSFELEIKNTGTHTVPRVAVTVDSFDYSSDYAELAENKRPVWVIERGPGAIAKPPVESQEISTPGGGQTAYVNTWALGALAPGKTREFTWQVVPVKSGSYTVHYTVAAGLAGRTKARLASGAPVQGQFAVDIDSAPALTHVNPSTGHVETGAFPASP